jgi:RNA polymerase sigma-70 factor (ECF subfamily)
LSTTRHPEFAAVALGFLSAIYNAAHRMTGDQHDAEDLAQETYVEAFRHAEQLRDLADCKAWLFRILRNRFISSERKRRARPELVMLEGGVDTVDSNAARDSVMPPLERTVMERLTRPAIVHALERLPDELRTVLLLCDLEGFTYEEISQIMGCPIGTVRSRIARARARLVKQLANHAAALGVSKEPSR